MNLYHSQIELKDGEKALAFAQAAEAWFGALVARGLIADWRLFRRKFGLASGAHSDFILEVMVEDLAQLDTAFATLGRAEDDETQRLYDRMHDMIATARHGLYRPYPDPAQRERVALV
ncbi:DUF6614 family protein [Wenxinia saemankumensis]|uniref:Uncharacterized protein n=1 Tax=Wenxinia saemankumensis TaxID=1447782 RepID=A0A1M6A1E6_9RHOB|nr:DUF6614 family protein [Wenxinia saemankumensis]SHI30290.1 hypothetical protein SAMN05444417_0152 [Wenxinia saemankumensis]